MDTLDWQGKLKRIKDFIEAIINK